MHFSASHSLRSSVVKAAEKNHKFTPLSWNEAQNLSFCGLTDTVCTNRKDEKEMVNKIYLSRNLEVGKYFGVALFVHRKTHTRIWICSQDYLEMKRAEKN